MQRYIAQPADWAMAEDANGDWVKYEDASELEARIATAERLLTTAVAGGRVPVSRLAGQVLEVLRGQR